MLDSCDFECESDVSDVDMTDQSECEIVAQVPAEPDIIVIRASKPVCKMLTDEAQVLKNTPPSKMSNLPPLQNCQISPRD